MSIMWDPEGQNERDEQGEAVMTAVRSTHQSDQITTFTVSHSGGTCHSVIPFGFILEVKPVLLVERECKQI